MKQLVTAEQMRLYEGYLMETLGIPSLLLMERAAGYIKETAAEILKTEKAACVLVVSGCGNNGADGLAAARMLTEEGRRVLVVRLGDPEHASENNRIHTGILERMGIPLMSDLQTALEQRPDLIIDALFGIGLNRELKESYRDAVKQINQYRSCNEMCRVLSVDLPSGLHTDRGKALPEAVRADVTVTFGFLKRGMYLNEGRRYCGRVICCPIGPERRMADDYRMEWAEIADLKPKRDPLGHKGTFGKVLCIAGCADMAGASILNAGAALRSGCGMVKVIGVSQNRDLLLHTVPEAMFAAVDSEEGIGTTESAKLHEALAWADTILIGSGLGKERALRFLKCDAIRNCEKPMVIDADGLNALTELPDFLKHRKEQGAVTFLTPHPGEFARLFSETEKNGCQEPETVRALAKEYGVILIAKSATTLVTDGIKVYYNDLGSDALATAGSGDVLAGVLAAVSCVIKEPLQAAVYADALHAMAGEMAAAQIGTAAVTASEILKMLPEAMNLRKAEKRG